MKMIIFQNKALQLYELYYFFTKDGNDEENNIRRVVEDDAQIL